MAGSVGWWPGGLGGLVACGGSKGEVTILTILTILEEGLGWQPKK